MLNIHLYNDLKIFGWFGVVALYGILSKILYRTIMPRYALFCIVTIALFAIYKDVVLGLIKKKGVNKSEREYIIGWCVLLRVYGV